MSTSTPATNTAQNGNQSNQNASNLQPTVPLPPITSFMRYLYTGVVSSSIPASIPIDSNSVQTTLACVIEMARARASLPISTIRKVYQTKLYFRVDEVLIALAYCARQNDLSELKQLAYSEAITLINNQDDFVLFVHYCVKISEQLNGAGKWGFGAGMRRMIKEWYKKYPVVDLANFFGEHRSLHGWTHKNIFERAHVRTRPLPAVPSAPQQTPPNTESSSNEATVQVPTPSGSKSGIEPLAATELASNIKSAEIDRQQVMQFVFYKGSREYLKYLSEIPAEQRLGPGAKRLQILQKLKTNEKVNEAVKVIRDHKISIEQIPSHLLEKKEVWEILLPTMSYRSIIKYFHTIRDFGFFNEDNAFVNQFITHCCDFDKLKSENLCPVNLFIQLRLYEKNLRYLSTTKAEYYEKKVSKRKIQVNQRVKQQLEHMFTQTLIDSKPAPASYFVTIDLRKGGQKRHVLRNKHINSFEASILLAYSIFARESNALLYTFTEDPNQLTPLHGMLSKKNFNRAMDMCEALATSKTRQSLAKPIQEATRLQKKVDVFVVIVDSVARFCRQGQVPTKEFAEYKANFNDRAKYVVVNLARPKGDLLIPPGNDMKGFFEICGFSDNVPKLLNALGKHCFT